MPGWACAQVVPDPGAPAGAVRGRWRIQPPCGNTGPLTASSPFSNKGCVPPAAGCAHFAQHPLSVNPEFPHHNCRFAAVGSLQTLFFAWLSPPVNMTSCCAGAKAPSTPMTLRAPIDAAVWHSEIETEYVGASKTGLSMI
jgi:hypothetical protein